MHSKFGIYWIHYSSSGGTNHPTSSYFCTKSFTDGYYVTIYSCRKGLSPMKCRGKRKGEKKKKKQTPWFLQSSNYLCFLFVLYALKLVVFREMCLLSKNGKACETCICCDMRSYSMSHLSNKLDCEYLWVLFHIPLVTPRLFNKFGSFNILLTL